MSIIKSITSVFQGINKDTSSDTDPTRYKVITSTHEHLGKIIHQDGIVINFKNEESKHIKILKANIQSISIVADEQHPQPKKLVFQKF